MSSPAQGLSERIVGVVAGLPTLFNSDYSVNHEGMRAHVQFLVEGGIKVLMLSRGVSELAYLSYEEIKAVTKSVVDAAAGRAVVIASTFEWWTGQAAEFVRYAQDVGADGCLVVLPPITSEYCPALHDNAFCRHFEAIAEAARMDLIIHERNVASWRGAGVPLSLSLLDRLADIDQVVGLKMEGGDRTYGREVMQRTRGRLAIIGDWGPQEFFFSHPYGVTANITGVGQFAPSVALRFWSLLRGGELHEARQLANKVLLPYYARAASMDWVAAMKASMEFVGLPASPVRPPNAQLTPEQREQLRQTMLETGLLTT